MLDRPTVSMAKVITADQFFLTQDEIVFSALGNKINEIS